LARCLPKPQLDQWLVACLCVGRLAGDRLGICSVNRVRSY
jgi:hypothetical protein